MKRRVKKKGRIFLFEFVLVIMIIVFWGSFIMGILGLDFIFFFLVRLLCYLIECVVIFIE